MKYRETVGKQQSKIYKIWIPFLLPGLNQYISECRRHWSAGARMKKNFESILSAIFTCELRNIKVKPPVKINYLWVESDMKRDKDNISGFGRKMIQDALQKSGVLSGDGWDYITGFSDSFCVDKKKSGVMITIIEEGKR